MKHIYFGPNNTLHVSHSLTAVTRCFGALVWRTSAHAHAHPAKALIKICLWYGPNVFIKRGSGGGAIKTQRVELKWPQRGAITPPPPHPPGAGSQGRGWEKAVGDGMSLNTRVSGCSPDQCPFKSYSNFINGFIHTVMPFSNIFFDSHRNTRAHVISSKNNHRKNDRKNCNVLGQLQYFAL